MSKFAGKEIRLYIGGYDISPITSGIGMDGEIEALPYSVADGVNGYHYVRGLSKDILKFDGLFDDNYHQVLTDLLKVAATKQMIALFGTTLGATALAADAVLNPKYKMNAVTKDILRLTAELPASGLPWDDCLLLQPKTQFTTDGSGAALDNGAATAAGLIAYLQVFKCGADDALIVKVQMDTVSNFAHPTDLITFTTANGITTERKTAAGAIEQYLRVVRAGTAPYQATFAVVVKRT